MANIDKQHYFYQNGCTLIDLVTGGGKGVFGYPTGRIINICGDKSSGKTMIVNEIIAKTYHQHKDKFKFMYADCERGYSFDSKKLYGFDIITSESDLPDTVEEACYCIQRFAKSIKDDEFGIYVLDSLDALSSDEQDKIASERYNAIEKGKTYDKGSYQMGKAKYLSQEFFPQISKIIENKNILLIIISQIRDNVEQFSFEKYSRSGGKALDFYCYMVIWLITMKKITVSVGEENRIIGGVNKLKVTKGKVERPFRECFYSYIFDYGIDDIGTSVDFLFDLRTKTGELKSQDLYFDESKKKMSVSELRQYLIDNKYYDEFKEFANGQRFNSTLAFSFLDSKKELLEEIENEFTIARNRDEMINYIENNNLSEILKERVIAKWESIEDSISSNRKSKY